jgi:hypothetical protein
MADFWKIGLRLRPILIFKRRIVPKEQSKIAGISMPGKIEKKSSPAGTAGKC